MTLRSVERMLGQLFYMSEIKSVLKKFYMFYLATVMAAFVHWLIVHLPHVFAILCILIFLFVIVALAGLTTVARVRNFVDEVLAYKLLERKGYKTKNITFNDMKQAGCIPLKIIATNTTCEKLEVFSVEHTPDVNVADAVAASICLPFIFRPWFIKFERHTVNKVEKVHGRFFDGGLVSNMPAWPFDEERLLFPETTTVALGFESATETTKKHWLPTTINAIVNGTGEIDTRATGTIIKIPLKTDLTTLDFDLYAYRAFREIKESKKTVTNHLLRELIQLPEILKKAAEDIYELIKKLLDEYDGIIFHKQKHHRVRVAIAAQRAGAMNSLSLAFLAGYEPSDSDRHLTIPMDAPFVDEKRDTVFREVPEEMRAYLFAGDRIWRDMQWVISIPLEYKDPSSNPEDIISKKIRRCVILIDSNVEFDYKLKDAKQRSDEFVQRADAKVEQYNKETRIEEIVQGHNTWL